MSENKLLVLYESKNGTQHWAIYSGLEKEANEEKQVMESDGFIEVGRIPVTEHKEVTYSKRIQ